ncbi:MAG: hypothetical protein PHP45_04670 [Elusimicrobiales bacterium]|nr:hypothetical protein [Elusimicrobiales bacterium]
MPRFQRVIKLLQPFVGFHYLQVLFVQPVAQSALGCHQLLVYVLHQFAEILLGNHPLADFGDYRVLQLFARYHVAVANVFAALEVILAGVVEKRA